MVNTSSVVTGFLFDIRPSYDYLGKKQDEYSTINYKKYNTVLVALWNI